MYDMLGALTNLLRTPSRVQLRAGADRTRVNPVAPDALLWAGQQGATGWWGSNVRFTCRSRVAREDSLVEQADAKLRELRTFSRHGRKVASKWTGRGRRPPSCDVSLKVELGALRENVEMRQGVLGGLKIGSTRKCCAG